MAAKNADRLVYDPKRLQPAKGIDSEAARSCLANEVDQMSFLGSAVQDEHRIWDFFRDKDGDLRYLTRYYTTDAFGRRRYLTSSEWLFGHRIPEWDSGEKPAGKTYRKK